MKMLFNHFQKSYVTIYTSYIFFVNKPPVSD